LSSNQKFAYIIIIIIMKQQQQGRGEKLAGRFQIACFFDKLILQSYGKCGSHQMQLMVIGMVQQSQSYGMVHGMILVLTY
jgi:hypothetical protein